ncbi:hypothetical protein PF005_g20232 [Phytophthora fragariae]|uniref:Uncharacterized protein n=1 Tax=Phytophthora fragariae TaxID=53985 RepID=A0A6A3WXA4_9STRA|nr:hypothetical protein PF005_g20232 [Phytophthora fragariae]
MRPKQPPQLVRWRPPTASTAAQPPAATPPPPPTPCAAAALTPAHVLNRPGRVGGRLAVTPLPGAAPAAVPSADQVAVQDPVQTTYAHSATEFKCSVCAYIAGNMVTLVVHRRSAHRGTHLSDIFDSGCACSLVFHPRVAATSRALACAQRASQAMLPAGEPMDVDQGRVPPSQRRASPRRPSERCPDGKRRRLNCAYDDDAQNLAEDGAKVKSQAHTPSADSALSASVLAVYVHNAHRFNASSFQGCASGRRTSNPRSARRPPTASAPRPATPFSPTTRLL